MIDLPRFKHSFGYAMEGIIFAFKRDQNIRIHFFVALLVIFFSLVLDVNPFEMGILGIMILFVIVTEMINTVIENMVDLITKEHHEEAKRAKDVASGMVLLTASGSIIVGILIFLPHILRLLNIIH
ncbi:MAG TPA: diacylglycerol kinase family protein [Patescibacteria group bacterium]|nr:diacylglycerol kinase family protein [Patescibacteria group bacterium]